MENVIYGAYGKGSSSIISRIRHSFDRWFGKDGSTDVYRMFRCGNRRVVWVKNIGRDRAMTLTRLIYTPDGDRVKVVKQTFVLKPGKGVRGSGLHRPARAGSW